MRAMVESFSSSNIYRDLEKTAVLNTFAQGPCR